MPLAALICCVGDVCVYIASELRGIFLQAIFERSHDVFNTKCVALVKLQTSDAS